ncbi:hypothetical protein KZZ52_09300 [Dactylosporangium sp. AC04546]|uniref:hypothetical protein n=1 Tax=Dactylosporangium sp. AC04546 TaxID=2862460 RepID=UPI001EDF1CC3|nr:hypothetical protein [Dactylosporangium sp. AC04546]WVK85563.1 hypothetical protein KZZ52_09300 [Dactylosporangium sp. AC04546]
MTITAADWPARRLFIEVDGSFDDAVARYEALVPEYPAARFERLVADKADWRTVLSLTDEIARHGFLIYWRFSSDSVFGLAGDTARWAAYLMGNHTIAERMTRHDPAAMLYAPLRTVISQARGGPTRFAVEQPSLQFASLGNPDITAVGIELDHKLAALLGALHWPVPDGLTP